MKQKKKSSTSKPKGRSSATKSKGTSSARTKKQIDSLSEHAREIYKEAHANALKQYQNPAKRRGGKKQSTEQVAHKTAWAAVERKYEKLDDTCVEK
jgi:cation transport regulator